MLLQGVSWKRYFRRKGLLFCEKRKTQEREGKMVWFGLCWSSKVYTMEVDRREKSVEQSTNTILNPSARSENTFFMNCPVPGWLSWWVGWWWGSPRPGPRPPANQPCLKHKAVWYRSGIMKYTVGKMYLSKGNGLYEKVTQPCYSLFINLYQNPKYFVRNIKITCR